MMRYQLSSGAGKAGRAVAGLSLIGIALGACSPQDAGPSTAGPSAAAPQAAPATAAATNEPFIPEATIQELMEYVVMPNAQVLWDSVATIVSRDGVENRAPQSDEDWDRVRSAAITLAEASNALMIRGRNVDVPGTPADDPDDELSPDQIQALRQKEWPAWVSFASALHATAMQALNSIDARDSGSLMDAGGPIDEACESCHLQFWYPPDLNAAQ
jgi:hypothetical protein